MVKDSERLICHSSITYLVENEINFLSGKFESHDSDHAVTEIALYNGAVMNCLTQQFWKRWWSTHRCRSVELWSPVCETIFNPFTVKYFFQTFGYVCMYVCIDVCMYVCMYVCVTHPHWNRTHCHQTICSKAAGSSSDVSFLLLAKFRLNSTSFGVKITIICWSIKH